MREVASQQAEKGVFYVSVPASADSLSSSPDNQSGNLPACLNAIAANAMVFRHDGKLTRSDPLRFPGLQAPRLHDLRSFSVVGPDLRSLGVVGCGKILLFLLEPFISFVIFCSIPILSVFARLSLLYPLGKRGAL